MLDIGQIQQARYFPYLSGKYEVSPGLKPFGFDFGNGEMDQRVLQLDRNYAKYGVEKSNAASRHAVRHILSHNCPRIVIDKVLEFIGDRLAFEYPGMCLPLSGWNSDQGLSPWMAIGLNLQEDLAISISDGERDWLAAIHVCLPAPWAPEEKIGKSFQELHEPVPGMQKIASSGSQFARMMIEAKKGLVRFVWGLTPDNSLNKHPVYQPQPDFCAEKKQCFVRVERQTIWGFPEVGASLFLIRPYFYDMFDLIKDRKHKLALRSAIKGMSAKEVKYKIGSEEERDILLKWLV